MTKILISANLCEHLLDLFPSAHDTSEPGPNGKRWVEMDDERIAKLEYMGWPGETPGETLERIIMTTFPNSPTRH